MRQVHGECPLAAPKPALYLLFGGLQPNAACLLDDLYLGLAQCRL